MSCGFRTQPSRSQPEAGAANFWCTLDLTVCDNLSPHHALKEKTDKSIIIQCVNDSKGFVSAKYRDQLLNDGVEQNISMLEIKL